MASLTTSLVLTEDQHRLLKQVASMRVLNGTAKTASVSEVIRQLIEDNMEELRKELQGNNSK